MRTIIVTGRAIRVAWGFVLVAGAALSPGCVPGGPRPPVGPAAASAPASAPAKTRPAASGGPDRQAAPEPGMQIVVRLRLDLVDRNESERTATFNVQGLVAGRWKVKLRAQADEPRSEDLVRTYKVWFSGPGWHTMHVQGVGEGDNADILMGHLMNVVAGDLEQFLTMRYGAIWEKDRRQPPKSGGTGSTQD